MTHALADDAVRGKAGDRAAGEDDRARAWAQQPRDRVHESGLARPVGSQERHDLAVADVDVGVPEHLVVLQEHIQAARLEDQTRHASPR